MSSKTENKIYIYIDANNLYQNARNYFGWRLNYTKFYTWLVEKYKTENIYLFIGHIPEYYWLYKKLQRIGFRLVFKEITRDNTGKAKGNCDADMAHTITKDFYEQGVLKKQLYKAVLVTADGDFASTIKFLRDKDALEIVLAPCPDVVILPNGNEQKPLSFLIRNLNIKIEYLHRHRDKLS